MAMGLASAGGSSRRRGRARRSSAQAISEINVTPLVDVMLVLLIVFMVAAPLLTVGVPIDLPKTAASTMQPDKKPVMVTIDSAGKVFVGEEETDPATIVEMVAAQSDAGLEERIYLRGDTETQYGAVMKIMGALSGAGYAHIGLITKQEQE